MKATMASLGRLRCQVFAPLLLVAISHTVAAVGLALPHGEDLAAAQQQQQYSPLRGRSYHSEDTGALPEELLKRGMKLYHTQLNSTDASRDEDDASAGRLCLDAPLAWKSSSGNTCKEYDEYKWCTITGDYGKDWGDNGKFSAWAGKGGVSAAEACCACGGGSQASVVVGDFGSETCPEGQSISDEATCTAASKSLHAAFAFAARWGVGYPTGCHIDSQRKTVWLNTHSAGTARGEFAPLCLVYADAEEKNEDDDEESGSGSKESLREGSSAGAQHRSESEASLRLRKEVVEAHQALVRNMKKQVQIGLELHGLDDQTASHQDIDASMKEVAEETQSKAMATFLGDMWSEMRIFASPFYEERLEEKLGTLEKQKPQLEAAYNAAKKKLSDLDESA